MIRKWKLYNFKSISKPLEIEFKPLTILAGANSSGKSTVLQSILLISQTLSKRNNSDSLILNGPLVQLGQFDDIRSFGSSHQQISFGWQIDSTYKTIEEHDFFSNKEPITITCDFSFEADASRSEDSQFQPSLFGCEIKIASSNSATKLISSHNKFIENKYFQNLQTKSTSDIEKALKYNVDTDSYLTQQITSYIVPYEQPKLVGVSFLNILPNKILVHGLDPDFNSETNKVEYFQKVEFANLPNFFSHPINQMIITFSSKIRYLGPLRDEPKILYPFNFSDNLFDVGLRGEHSASVLDQNKIRRISYINPEIFKSNSLVPQLSVRTLQTAVNDWLLYMDVAQSVQTNKSGHFGYEMKVFMDDDTTGRDLTHVGVGISQVLPILVMCLLADKETIIVLEQPELHLHPKVQTRLADFFLSMALLGKQLIIETHSEYIVNRLRFRAASAKTDTVSSLLKLYFVQKEAGNSIFKDVVVTQYGAILDWPDGFFDQAQDEAEDIIRAATLKIKMDRGK